MSGGPEALAATVRARRRTLRLPYDLTALGGPSEMTVRKIENADPTPLRPSTKERLGSALRWPEGFVDQVLTGRAGLVEQAARVTEAPDLLRAIAADIAHTHQLGASILRLIADDLTGTVNQ